MVPPAVIAPRRHRDANAAVRRNVRPYAAAVAAGLFGTHAEPSGVALRRTATQAHTHMRARSGAHTLDAQTHPSPPLTSLGVHPNMETITLIWKPPHLSRGHAAGRAAASAAGCARVSAGAGASSPLPM